MDIYFSTPHGQYKIEDWRFNQTFKQLCKINGIPHQSVSFYGKKNGQFSLIIGLNKTLDQFVADFEVIQIKADRNIDYFSVLLKKNKFKPEQNCCSEYIFTSDDSQEEHHLELTAIQCKNYVKEKVKDFLKHEVVIHPTDKIILGVSGGGDSNTLMMSFIESGLVNKDQILAVMMLGIPDWDLGKLRAQEICDDLGVSLEFISEQKINELLGRKNNRSWVEDFEILFPDADLEILGTHALNLAFQYMAKKVSAQAVVTGLNLEDILSEAIYCTIKGNLPPPFPVRPIDGLDFWHPLYKVPKKIIDGCYPKYSLENYNDRYPSRMIGRAIPYYLAQSIHCLIPGAEFDLLEGYQKMSKKNTCFGIFDEKMGHSVLELLSTTARKKWEQFVNL